MNMQDDSNSIALRTFINGCLTSLGDPGFQKEVWEKGKWEKWTTYSEVYMDFCSWCRPILETPSEYNLTPLQIEGLQKLYNMIEVFNEKIPENLSLEDHKRILSDPKWLQIQEQARKVKSSLSSRI